MVKRKSSHSDHWPQHIENVEESGDRQADGDTRQCHTSTNIPRLNHGNVGPNRLGTCATPVCHKPAPRGSKKHPTGLWLQF